MSDLIARIEAAETKGDLDPLADALGLTLNKRKGLETLRAELLDAVPAESPTESPAPARQPVVAPRMLRHKGNGRTFIWTAALAKRRDLEEI